MGAGEDKSDVYATSADTSFHADEVVTDGGPDESGPDSAYRANLEVSKEAGFVEIKASYRALMRRYHPDLHGGDIEKREYAEKITAQLNEAYSYFEKMNR